MTRQLEVLLGSVRILEAAELHPNKMRFRGVLVRLDEPSTRPPNGADGHRIMVPSAVAQKRLSTLIGMGLNYAEDMDGHAQRRKVGVIQKAYIKGKDLWVEGIVWKHDFPEATTDLKQKDLGMSMEIGQVQVDDVKASVWQINDFYFLGATILFRDSAAYNRTQAIAAQADKRSATMKTVPQKKKPAATPTATINAQEIAAAATRAAVEGVSKTFGGTFARQTKILAGMAGQMEDFNSRLAAMETRYEIINADAGEDDEDEDIEATGDVVTPVPRMATKGKLKAAKKPAAADEDDEDDEDDDEDEEDDDDIESEAIDKGDLDELGPDTEGDEGEPGHQNEDVENQGDKTTVKDKVGKTVSSSILASLRRQMASMTKRQVQLEEENKQLRKKLKKTSMQVTAAATDLSRRSRPIHADVTGLLAKSGIDPLTMQASAQKLTVAEVDMMLASSLPNIDVTSRMTLKNKMIEMGLMEDGVVHRQVIPRG